MATQCSILAWRISWTEEASRLWGHKSRTWLSDYITNNNLLSLWTQAILATRARISRDMSFGQQPQKSGYQMCAQALFWEIPCQQQQQKITSWKLRIMWVFFGGVGFWAGILGSFTQGTVSEIAPRNCSFKVREEPGYTGVFTKAANSLSIKALLWIKNQTSQVNEHSTRPCVRRSKCWAS